MSQGTLSEEAETTLPGPRPLAQNPQGRGLALVLGPSKRRRSHALAPDQRSSRITVSQAVCRIATKKRSVRAITPLID